MYYIIIIIEKVTAGGTDMVSVNVIIQSEAGLRHNSAACFVQMANEYKSSIRITHGEKEANAKSLLGVLALGVLHGTQVKLTVDGSDEKEAIENLVELVSRK